MTDVTTAYTTITDEMLVQIDGFLDNIKHVNLVKAGEVVDFCLDLRQIIDKGYNEAN